MAETTPVNWTVTALNLPDHAANPIHTDEGARAKGFPAALVAGVTTYLYLTHPPAAAWGAEWVGGGGCEVSFSAPVFDKDDLTCSVDRSADGDLVVSAMVGGDAKAAMSVWSHHLPRPEQREGQSLPAVESPLEKWRTYPARAGDDLGLYGEHDIVHPAAWPSLANEVMSRHLVEGSWIHLRSHIRHHGLARPEGVATATSTLVRSFSTSRGDRAVVDVEISVDGALVATLEHEAYVRLND